MSLGMIWLLAGGFACLIGLGISGVALLSAQKRGREWDHRRELAIGPYLKPKTSTGPLLLMAPRIAKSGGAAAKLHAVVNWREDRRSQYPMPWWGVVLVMIGPSLIAALLATKVIGPIAWLTLPVFDLLLTRLFLGWAVARVSTTLLTQFPDALSMISRAVRVGVPLGEAVRLVSRESQSPTREEFARAGDQVAIGRDLEVALLEMAERNDLNEYRFFATALSLQSQTGGGLTETLETLADTIRKRESARKRGHALASEARTSIYVLAALPIVVGAMLFVINPDYVGLLFTDPAGEKMLGIACFMLGAGLVAMQQIVKRSLS